ncbi:MAG: Do family serine endopeptidase [Synergistaceae bacterium]|jgi:serine protease Do|nr:Do family serine endopeptidase [Synergistaceae bacterium]
MARRIKVFAVFAMVLAFMAAAVSAMAASGGIIAGDGTSPIVALVRECSPAVVNIDTEKMVKRSFGPFGDDPFFREFFGREFENFNRTIPMKGKGSGFIVDGKEGYILTNNHVVGDADKITVTLLDGRTFEASLVGKDPTFDLAVVQVKADNLPSLELGDSDAAEVGEWVVAIGNPHGFENSVTAGIISAKNRTLQAADVNFRGFLQTDAAINPGNSGGPLIDMKGRVVGINTAIVPFAQGLGFAVPVNMAKQIMNDLIENGEVKRGMLGIMLQDLDPAFAETYKVPVERGAVVAQVMPDSPAEKAGLKRGDVISAIDGNNMTKASDVVFYVRGKLAGDSVSLEIYRDSKKQTVKVELGEMEDDSGQGRRSRGRDQGDDDRGAGESTRIGARVGRITPDLREEYGLDSDKGLVVIDVERGSVADAMGLRRGDQILEANRREITGISDWERAMSGSNKTVVLLVNREGRQRYFMYKN